MTFAELGGPTASTDYALCLYRHDSLGDALGLVLAAQAPAGGTCGARPCWSAVPGKGFKYTARAAPPDGLTKIVLRAGSSGEARAVIKGAGPNLRFRPVIGLPPVIAQLRAANGPASRHGLEAEIASHGRPRSGA